MKSLYPILFSFLIFTMSCQTSNVANLYLPSTLPNYLLSEKSDNAVIGGIKLNHLTTRTNIQSLELQGAYAIKDDIFLAAGFSHFNQTTNEISFTKQTAGELAVGFYEVFPINENSRNIFECITGYGLISASQISLNHDHFSTNWNKFFFQISYGFQSSNSKGFQLSVCPTVQMSLLSMFNLTHTSNLDLTTRDLFTHSLGFTVKVGHKRLQLMGRVSTHFPFGNYEEYLRFVDKSPPLEALTLGVVGKF